MSEEKRTHINNFIRFILKETFFDLNINYKKNLNVKKTENKKLLEFNKLKINNDNRIKIGHNLIIIDNVEVGSFVVDSFGNIQDVHNKKVYKNSLFLQGGFIINNENKNLGIGREAIKKIFIDNKKIENILLYAVDWQGAVDFWLKIGGKIIFRDNEKELNFIKINRNDVVNK